MGVETKGAKKDRLGLKKGGPRRNIAVLGKMMDLAFGLARRCRWRWLKSRRRECEKVVIDI